MTRTGILAFLFPTILLAACQDRGAAPLSGPGLPSSSASAAAACAGPPEAYHPVSYRSFASPPYGFRSATPWLNVVHDAGNAGTSTVEIDYIRLIGRVNGVDQVLSANEYADGVFSGQIAMRTPWYGEPIENLQGRVANGILVIRPSDKRNRVWHPYLELYPRADIRNATNVRMEVRFRITGAARVQAGLDYWQYPDGKTNHDDPSRRRLVEAAVTDWYCASAGWQTVGMETGTKVPDPIVVTTLPAGQPVRVGVPLRVSFTLRNADDDPVGLRRFGIETRRVVNGDPYCDPSVSQHLHAFAWHSTTMTLAPGASFTHTARWTPSEPGTYCLAVVEKRLSTPDWMYQRPYDPRGHYRIRVAP